MVKSAGAALGLMLALALPAQAQDWKFDVGLHGGFGWWSSMLTDDELGEGTSNVKFDAGWLTGAQATWWLTPRLGLRLNAGYTDRPLVAEEDDFDSPFDDELESTIIESVNLWSGTGDLMIRLGGSGKFLPYLALGLGAKWVNPAGSDFEVGDLDGRVFIDPSTDPDRVFMLEEGSTLMVLNGLGSDIRLANNFGLRVEIGDRIFDAPIQELTLDPDEIFDVLDEEDVGKITHEIYGQLGLHMLFGMERPQEVSIAPAPPPPPPVYTAPAPARRDVSVCVIDPTTPGGIRTVNAFYFDNAPRDTLVTVNGRDVSLRSTTGNVMVASNAQWFTAGQPMTLQVGRQRVEFVTYGTSRLIDAGDLAFLGTVNGLPVYADRAEVQDVLEELEEGRRARNSDDLSKILEEDRDLREDLSDIGIVYVPLQPTGCVFQPLQRTVEARKTRR